jgi:hypothetical protein
VSSPNLDTLTTFANPTPSIRATERTKRESPFIYLLGNRGDHFPINHGLRILHSLSTSTLSTTQRVAVSDYSHPDPAKDEELPIFLTLASSIDLRKLTLIRCNSLSFIITLNPEESLSKLGLCPNLEELVLHNKSQNQFHIEYLISMTKNRALRGGKLSLVAIAGLRGLAPKEGAFKPQEHVTHVHCRVSRASPAWDYSWSEWSERIGFGGSSPPVPAGGSKYPASPFGEFCTVIRDSVFLPRLAVFITLFVGNHPRQSVAG